MSVTSAAWTMRRVSPTPGETSSDPRAMSGSIPAKSAPGHVSGTRAPSIRPSFALSSRAARASSGVNSTSARRSVRRTCVEIRGPGDQVAGALDAGYLSPSDIESVRSVLCSGGALEVVARFLDSLPDLLQLRLPALVGDGDETLLRVYVYQLHEREAPDGSFQALGILSARQVPHHQRHVRHVCLLPVVAARRRWRLVSTLQPYGFRFQHAAALRPRFQHFSFSLRWQAESRLAKPGGVLKVPEGDVLTSGGEAVAC